MPASKGHPQARSTQYDRDEIAPYGINTSAAKQPARRTSTALPAQLPATNCFRGLATPEVRK